jgi:polyhydroxybutyrate depolymerase
VRDGPDDVGYLLALIDDARTRVPIDRRRIYLVGMSNSATMAARFICEHPEQVAAFAQVAGTAAEEVGAACRPALPVPILNVHGTRDRFAPYAGGRARGLRARLVLRHPAGPCIGVDEWARHWVDGNGAADGPHTETIPPDATVRRWRGPTRACDVVFYRIGGGGHTWPGNRTWVPPVFGRASCAFDATRVAWDFLAAHAREA